MEPNELVRNQYKGCKISNIAGATFRVTRYEEVPGFCPIKKIGDTFLVDVIGGLVVRRPEVQKRLLKYSNKW
jgi:hypothetical protein